MRPKDVLAGLSIAVALGLPGCNTETLQNTPPRPPSQNRPEQSGSQPVALHYVSDNEWIIKQRSMGKDMPVGINENSLWQTGFPRPVYNYREGIFLKPEESDPRVTERVYKSLDLMIESQNPYFSTTGFFLKNVLQRGTVIFTFTSNPMSPLQKTDRPTSSTTESTEIGIRVNTRISPQYIVEESDSMRLAFTLVGEATRIVSMLDYQSAHNSKTREDYQRVEAKRKDDLNQYVTEEARARAKIAQAYILQYRFGYRGGVDTELEDNAVQFIQLGGDPQRPALD